LGFLAGSLTSGIESSFFDSNMLVLNPALY
jgi:hypothetical protein